MQQERQEASPDRPAPHPSTPRILHVIHGLEFDGGIEVWLLHLLRHIDRRDYPTDVLVLSRPGGALEGDYRALGCQIFHCPERNPWSVDRRLTQILAAHGPYDIVHSHMHHFGGLIVRRAARQRVPIRNHPQPQRYPEGGERGRFPAPGIHTTDAAMDRALRHLPHRHQRPGCRRPVWPRMAGFLHDCSLGPRFLLVRTAWTCRPGARIPRHTARRLGARPCRQVPSPQEPRYGDRCGGGGVPE